MKPVAQPLQHSARANWLIGLEALRGWAAAAIVFYHVVHLYGIQGAGLIGVVREYFGLAVPMFFVVSAFSLYHAHFEGLFTVAGLRAYFVKRLFRIAPLFYLLLLYMNVRRFVLEGSTFPPGTIAENVTFIFGLIPGSAGVGIVWASWSIGVEMVFYLLFPLFLLFARSIRSAGFVVAATIFLALRNQEAIAVHVAKAPLYTLLNYLKFMPVFATGILGYMVHRRLMTAVPSIRRRAAGAMLVFAALIAAVLVAAVPLTFPDGRYRPAMGNFWLVMAFTFVFTLVVIAEAVRPTRLITNAISRGLGKWSYSLYLIHTVVITHSRHVAEAFRTRFPMPELATFFVLSAATFAILVPLCWATYRFVEEPGMRFGSRMARRLLERENRC